MGFLMTPRTLWLRRLILPALLAFPTTAQAVVCATTKVVKQAGGGDCTTIQACVNLIPAAMTGHFCIDIQDSAAYSEQVVVEGKNPSGNAYQILIGSTSAQRPVITPPALSTAAFLVKNSGLTLQNLGLRPLSPIPYGVLASSALLTLSSVTVDGGANIYQAGVVLSSQSTVSFTSITVRSAVGLYLTGSNNTVSYSTALVTSGSSDAVFLNGAGANTFTVFLASSTATAFHLDHAIGNTISLRTMAAG